jgi:hypothetical protein
MEHDMSVEDDDEQVIRGQWLMDGATSLKQAAAQLRAVADHLESREAEGWQLTCRIDDDWGFIRRIEASRVS